MSQTQYVVPTLSDIYQDVLNNVPPAVEDVVHQNDPTV
jgi:hypothetical protein